MIPGEVEKFTLDGKLLGQFGTAGRKLGQFGSTRFRVSRETKSGPANCSTGGSRGSRYIPSAQTSRRPGNDRQTNRFDRVAAETISDCALSAVQEGVSGGARHARGEGTMNRSVRLAVLLLLAWLAAPA